jgi:hypothetical protein
MKSTLHEDLRTFMIIFQWILLRMRNVSGRVVENTKTHILYSVTFSRKSYSLWDNAVKFGTVRQATDDNIIWRMLFSCWTPKATDTHSEYVILIHFYGNNGYANAPQYYVIRTLPVLLYQSLSCWHITARWRTEGTGRASTFCHYSLSLCHPTH